ncbi:pseudouridylate synthase 7 homolog [Leptidea sinapis]|uniref:pseudouridylate synthase 7 homolog n=1 Tax=Leptidea sinapis TaxID=189913 RepID=UPI0021C351EF|nr:pseudouridylate synthase 7 homolog [Leptidea sinapis]
MSNNWRSNSRGGRRWGRGFRGTGEFRGMRRPFGNGPAGHRHQTSYQNSLYKNELQGSNNKPSQPVQKLTEKDIFVTEYISDHKGFNGIIKSRFSDFQVSEINEKGEIAQLTDLSAPEPPADGNAILDDDDLLLNKYNLEILPLETWDKINKLTLCTGPDFGSVELDVTGMSKEERTRIHEAVKKAFGDSIVGSTVTIDEKKYCKFEKYRKGVRVDNRVKWMWPGQYVHFIVYKENCDTMEAASRIMRRLRMNMHGD